MRHTSRSEIVAADPRPLSELAYEIIVGKIIGLDLPPGAALVEKTLSEELDLGRTPIREALQRLTVEGLICRTHYRGVYVCEVTTDSIKQVAEYRSMSDPLIARLAAERATEAEICELADCVLRMAELCEARNQDGYVRASRRFYAALAAATHNHHFEQSAMQIYNFDARLLNLAARTEVDWQALTASRLENAQALMDCIRRRVASEAEAVMRLYLVRYFERVIALLR